MRTNMVMHTKFHGAEYLDANEGLTRVYNLPKLMSSANRQEFKNVDNQGNAQLYTIGMRLYGSDLQAVAATAPNTYVTRRAVKDWHDGRVAMYKRAGISMKSLGYGRSLRPFLSEGHYEGVMGDVNNVTSITEIDTETDLVGTDASGISPGYTGDEWTYSRAAVSTPVDKDDTGDVMREDLVDTYAFILCGDSEAENNTTEIIGDESSASSDQDSYVYVGMLKEWLRSFSKARTAQTSASVVKEDNPLIMLRSQQGSDKKEVLDLAADGMQEARPWDLDGATHYSETVQAYFQSQTGESSYQVFQVPCGLFSLVFSNGATAQGARFDIDVLDIQDM